ncbi:thiamine phosphate synthase [Bacillus daqingensis]|uniref:Thiamine-phosphate synthase n=1 Tax=Bacillus daqingensis TaxID=872396 RepID=A0ABV9NRF2_9BACI
MTQFAKERLAVYFIAGTQNTDRPLPELVFEALRGGVTMFQLREKGTGSLQDEDERLVLAKELKELCARFHVPFIVNDDIELALASDADGLHIGQDDADPAEARRRIGAQKILGVSARTIAEAEAAAAVADYLGTGPMYATSSKEDAESPVGPERIQEMRNAGIHLPITAIGGITLDNAKPVLRAGADGVSVISAVSAAENAEAAASALLSIYRSINR